MPKDTNPVKRIVYIGTQCDDKYISRVLKKEGFRRLVRVNHTGPKIELFFSEELDYKPRKRVLQLSKKKHPNIKNEHDIIHLLAKEESTKRWATLETIEFPNKWLIFLTE